MKRLAIIAAIAATAAGAFVGCSGDTQPVKKEAAAKAVTPGTDNTDLARVGQLEQESAQVTLDIYALAEKGSTSGSVYNQCNKLRPKLSAKVDYLDDLVSKMDEAGAEAKQMSEQRDTVSEMRGNIGQLDAVCDTAGR